MKFSMSIDKKKSADAGRMEGHNARLHATSSQLPREAWITAQGCHSVIKSRPDVLEKARGLAKRKDAVVAVEIVIQVGNQTDWRSMPDTENPHGKKIKGASEKLNALIRGVKEAAISEFGAENIISVDLHTDESTPHAHIVFAPIHGGKLQAKHWLDGAAACAALRERLHSHVSKHIACDYEKGAPGGDPHDPQKAAGGIKAPKPPGGFLQRAGDAISSSKEVKILRDTVTKLQAQLQSAFSRQKAAELKAAAAAREAEEAARRAQAAERETRKAQKDSIELKTVIDALKHRIEAQNQVRHISVPIGLRNAPKPR